MKDVLKDRMKHKELTVKVQKFLDIRNEASHQHNKLTWQEPESLDAILIAHWSH